MKKDTVLFRNYKSMIAWLNDYKPKRGKYIRNSIGRRSIYAAFKPVKGKYKPK